MVLIWRWSRGSDGWDTNALAASTVLVGECLKLEHECLLETFAILNEKMTPLTWHKISARACVFVNFLSISVSHSKILRNLFLLVPFLIIIYSDYLLFFTAVHLVVRRLTGTKADNFQSLVPPVELPVLEQAEKNWLASWGVALKNTVVLSLRVAFLVLLFLPVAVSGPIALTWGVKRGEWMEMLRTTLEAAGPAFIKWGQWAATRHDLFPPDFCSELERLHSKSPAHGCAGCQHFRALCEYLWYTVMKTTMMTTTTAAAAAAAATTTTASSTTTATTATTAFL